MCDVGPPIRSRRTPLRPHTRSQFPTTRVCTPAACSGRLAAARARPGIARSAGRATRRVRGRNHAGARRRDVRAGSRMEEGCGGARGATPPVTCALRVRGGWATRRGAKLTCPASLSVNALSPLVCPTSSRPRPQDALRRGRGARRCRYRWRDCSAGGHQAHHTPIRAAQQHVRLRRCRRRWGRS